MHLIWQSVDDYKYESIFTYEHHGYDAVVAFKQGQSSAEICVTTVADPSASANLSKSVRYVITTVNI